MYINGTEMHHKSEVQCPWLSVGAGSIELNVIVF